MWATAFGGRVVKQQIMSDSGQDTGLLTMCPGQDDPGPARHADRVMCLSNIFITGPDISHRSAAGARHPCPVSCGHGMPDDMAG